MKAAKKLRRAVEKTARKDFISMVEECWGLPFRERFKIARMIFCGKGKKVRL